MRALAIYGNDACDQSRAEKNSFGLRPRSNSFSAMRLFCVSALQFNGFGAAGRKLFMFRKSLRRRSWCCRFDMTWICSALICVITNKLLIPTGAEVTSVPALVGVITNKLLMLTPKTKKNICENQRDLRDISRSFLNHQGCCFRSVNQILDRHFFVFFAPSLCSWWLSP